MIRTGLAVKTSAATNAISTADAKTHLRVNTSDDDTYIDNIVQAATAQIEAFTNRTMISTTYNFYLSDFPTGGITLPVSPVTEIKSIKYYDGDNNQQTYNSANYFWHTSTEPTLILPVDTWPDTYEDRIDAIDVEFVAGYTNAAAVPEALISSIQLLMTDLYENRLDYPREKFTAWKAISYSYRVFHSTMENK